MIPYEPRILPHSHYYFYTPSADAVHTFLYPTCAGLFHYAPGYALSRSSYDSILVMLVQKGSCRIYTNKEEALVKEGEIAFLNCYEPHGYDTTEGWDGLWLHFDGIMAKAYYDLIYQKHGMVIRLPQTHKAENLLLDVYRTLCQHFALKEAIVNEQLTGLLTLFLTDSSDKASDSPGEDVIEEAAAYLQKHMSEDITLDELAQRAYLSPYYFLRLFKKKTGYTPHEYLIATRIGAARFMLTTTQMPLKDICTSTGFHSVAGFCTAFKKWVGKTPTQFRRITLQEDSEPHEHRLPKHETGNE